MEVKDRVRLVDGGFQPLNGSKLEDYKKEKIKEWVGTDNLLVKPVKDKIIVVSEDYSMWILTIFTIGNRVEISQDFYISDYRNISPADIALIIQVSS